MNGCLRLSHCNRIVLKIWHISCDLCCHATELDTGSVSISHQRNGRIRQKKVDSWHSRGNQSQSKVHFMLKGKMRRGDISECRVFLDIRGQNVF